MNRELAKDLSSAVAQFWRTRARQLSAQGSKTGRKDAGTRGAVTGGKQLDGFRALIRRRLVRAGLQDGEIHERAAVLPGYFRPTKEWDLLVVARNQLVAVLEFKSQVGPSFGNNFNNRAEEALGSATDLWTAHREGAFRDTVRPWLGYFLLLEEGKGSTSPIAVKEPHFPALEEFRDASYAQRYALFCNRLVRERLYDAACLLLSPQSKGREGVYREPNAEVAFDRFVASLVGHVTGFVELHGAR